MADLRDPSLPACAVRDALGLSPHPEGGHYREMWRDQPASGGRGVGTSILFLLAAGERSHWHRVDAAEVWLGQAGAPLHLGIAGGSGRQEVRPGPDGRRGPAGRRPSRGLAGGGKPWRMEPGQLRRGPGVRVRRVRDGAPGLVASGRLTQGRNPDRLLPSADFAFRCAWEPG